MPALIDQSGFAELFIKDHPLLDVRAPGEFKHGAFPNAINLPLLNDEQRKTVGIKYKQSGQQAAIATGEQLIHAEEKRARLRAWQSFLETHPNALLYCFRGGLRSEIVQQWLTENGISIARIEGGYKALRRFLLDTLEEVANTGDFIIVAGKTGSGKTHLINQLHNSVDLEGCAHHRGSAFGRRSRAQPSQINFENSLAIGFLKLDFKRLKKLFLEDESRTIGSLSIPKNLHAAMGNSPLVVIEQSVEFRVETILHDYIISNYQDYRQCSPEHAEELFADSLLSSLDKIQRRLGGENTVQLRNIMNDALAATDEESANELHRSWIRQLLESYYDPMYEYQLSKKIHRVLFRGDRDEFLAWAAGIDDQ
ncbi:MAG TPA: tRNA 2-selenouridine(34) synthase MnmH [Gammaproteobacteria bacterium]|jgi:tRNA 2-selenouridine synthase|nr:tRNA 2-selenouridine(34) synthase MnmH [Gammaproteobacteria bacterium]MDP6731735.1 tRNA 2-selenouridine(34) synthase MnmH [Gammaproteobacteria bacterium]HAJ75481.1 tRNA 2-selenouridine(34) synthase MnmH [Gammaproteobacteria bacterium]|tara:strand:+ start:57 stop:1157 length:1101 start_codon:yes stop_codon:yes gene_type:complete